MKQLILLLALTATAYAEPLIYMTSSGGGGSFDPSATNAVLVASKAYTNATSNNLWQATSTALNGKLGKNGIAFTSPEENFEISTYGGSIDIMNNYNSSSGTGIHIPSGGGGEMKIVWDSRQDDYLQCQSGHLLWGQNYTIVRAYQGLQSGRALVSTDVDAIGVSSTTSTELGYVHGVTSPIQTQINSLSDTTARFTWANSILVAYSDSSATIPFPPSTSTALGLSSNTIYCKEDSTYKAFPRVICFGHTVNCAIGTAVGGVSPLTFSCDTAGVEIEFWVEFTLLKLDSNGYNANQIYHFKRTF